ncbi:MAG: trans-sulfuration enzyme family protein, partial [Phycisphaeraceae bacterium]
TYRLFSNLMPQMGIEFSFIDMADPANVERAIQKNTRGLWIETPSNPLLNIVDIEALVAVAKQHELTTIADNTFLSPVFQQPFEFGVDVIVHSTTKYLNGHSDVVGGAIIAKDETLAERIAYVCNATGVACSPFDAFLVLRGIKTLPQRMAAHERNAQQLAEWLEQHPKVQRVYYPGLKSHPQHERAKRQQRGFGGMLAFDLAGDADQARMDRLFAALELFLLAESLGGVESLIEQPWTMSHASMGEKGLAESGITPQTVRVSVGLEHVEDLKADLQRGFEAMDGEGATQPASSQSREAGAGTGSV